MPDIPALTLTSSTVDVGEIYENGIYSPAQPPDTLEVLNGGLTEENYDGGTGSIPAWACQLGSFAKGWYAGFDRFENVYAKQLNSDPDDIQRVIHAGLSMRVFLPWDASVLLYGFQGWFKHDATVWDADGTPQPEYWDLRVNINEGTQQSLYTRLPATRQSNAVGTSGSITTDDPGISDERRWKWVSKQGMVNTGLTKGYRTVQVTIWGRIYPDDECIAKTTTPTGGVWMLALR